MRTSKEVRKIINGIVEKLLKGYTPQKVILFGSYGYGSPRPDSDIDLLSSRKHLNALLIAGLRYDVCCLIPNA